MGLVLVFDLDYTIIDSSDFFGPQIPRLETIDPEILFKKIEGALNKNILYILLRAAKLRRSGKVSAICLLTNNVSRPFISAVDSAILRLSGGLKGKYKSAESTNTNLREMNQAEYFFDVIFPRYHRLRTVENRKGIEEVEDMLQTINLRIPRESLFDQLFFFDDHPEHALKADFETYSPEYVSHYIHITPQHRRDQIDNRTEYHPVLLALSRLDGHPPRLPPVVNPFPVRNLYPLSTPRRLVNASSNVNYKPHHVAGTTNFAWGLGGRRYKKTRRHKKTRRYKKTRRSHM